MRGWHLESGGSEEIPVGLVRGESLCQIAWRLERPVSTIAHPMVERVARSDGALVAMTA